MIKALCFLLIGLVQISEFNNTVGARSMDRVTSAPESQYVALSIKVPIFNAPFNIDGGVSGIISGSTTKPHFAPRGIEVKLMGDNLAGGYIRNGRVPVFIEHGRASFCSGRNLDAATYCGGRSGPIIPDGYRHGNLDIPSINGRADASQNATDGLDRQVGSLLAVGGYTGFGGGSLSMIQSTGGVVRGGLSLSQCFSGCRQSQENQNSRNTRRDSGGSGSPKHPSRPQGHALLGFQILFGIVCWFTSIYLYYRTSVMIWTAWESDDRWGEFRAVLFLCVPSFIVLLPIFVGICIDLGWIDLNWLAQYRP